MSTVTGPTLVDVGTRGLAAAMFAAATYTDQLGERLGPYSTAVDLAEGTLTFAGERGTEVADVALVCSVATSPPSLLWGWANTALTPGGPLDVATPLQDFGRRLGGQLAMPEIPTDEIAVPPDAQFPPDVFVATMAGAAVMHLAEPGVPWVVSPQPGQMVALHLRPRGTAVPLPDVHQVARAVMTPIEAGLVADHRALVQGMAESPASRGASIDWAPDGTSCELHLPGGTLRFEFDERFRLASLQGRLQGEA